MIHREIARYAPTPAGLAARRWALTSSWWRTGPAVPDGLRGQRGWAVGNGLADRTAHGRRGWAVGGRLAPICEPFVGSTW